MPRHRSPLRAVGVVAVASGAVAAGAGVTVRSLRRRLAAADRRAGEQDRLIEALRASVAEAERHHGHVSGAGVEPERVRIDALTGLANGSHLVERIEVQLERLAHDPTPVGVLVVDLDRFRAVNERAGYGVGDRLLADVGRRIDGVVRAGDLVARTGDDEFVVLFTSATSPDEATVVADRIRVALAEATAVAEVVGATAEPLTASIGIAFTAVAVPPGQLLDEARAALSLQRGSGGDGWALFDEELRSNLEWTGRRVAELRRAVERDEFTLRFQPIVDLASDAVVGAEVLARWEHPVDGLVGPGEFVPLAERVGLAPALGDRIVARAVRQLAAWDDLVAGRRFTLSINMSAADLADDAVVDRIEGRCRDEGVDPVRLRLELTETAVLDDPDTAIGLLDRFRGMGMTIALDDFGTGYASLSLLRRLPVDVVKIDQSFIAGLPAAPDAAVVRLVVGLASELGVAVVAEGVETDAQHDALVAMGCDLGQGTRYGEPLDADRFAELIVHPSAHGVE